jgi:hypothetical protein
MKGYCVRLMKNKTKMAGLGQKAVIRTDDGIALKDVYLQKVMRIF